MGLEQELEGHLVCSLPVECRSTKSKKRGSGTTYTSGRLACCPDKDDAWPVA